MKLKKLISKLKYSKESVYLLAEFHRRKGFEKALLFHEKKTAIQVALLILLCQMFILGVITLIMMM